MMATEKGQIRTDESRARYRKETAAEVFCDLSGARAGQGKAPAQRESLQALGHLGRRLSQGSCQLVRLLDQPLRRH